MDIFSDQEGNVPFWDDPSVHGGIVRPDNYQPRLDMMTVVSDFYHRRFLDEDELILVLIRDAIAINENQLRRLLAGRMTSYRLSNRIRYMAIYGLTDRWQMRSRLEGASKPSSPWSVGLGGFLYLKHRYPNFVMSPEKLINSGARSIQRYVAVNEIRTQMYEYQALKGWRWHGVVSTGAGRHNPKLGKPFGVGSLAGPKGDILLLIERLQQGQPFMDHIMSRLSNWNSIFIESNSLTVMDFPRLPVVVTLSVSTITMAEHVAKLIPVQDIKIPIWIIVDELLHRNGLPSSVLQLTNSGLKPIKLDWLRKREKEESSL